MKLSQSPARRAQRGVTLFGLVFWGVLVGFTAYVLVRTLPTVGEYLTVKRMVNQIAAANPGTVAEARLAFDRQRDVEYSVTALKGSDLVVTKENDKVVIAFAYEKEVSITGPVYILLKYEGRSK